MSHYIHKEHKILRRSPEPCLRVFETFVEELLEEKKATVGEFVRMTAAEAALRYPESTTKPHPKESKKAAEKRQTALEKADKFKGDLTEVFAELFFALAPVDPRYGIKSYKPVPAEDDFGVDATGINAAGDKVAIQVKYRTNPVDFIKYGDLAKTGWSAVKRGYIDMTKSNNIFLFTTNNGANYIAQKEMEGNLVVVNRQFIGSIVNNNHNFWSAAFESVIYTLKEDGVVE